MMTNQELVLAQKAQLYIAKEIRRICQKNGIKYTLAFGTLIGAVRHQGFIPWDDDMDIAMERQEYDKFLYSCQNDLGAEFYLQYYDTDPSYPWPFLKIRLNRTVFKSEWDCSTMHSGIWVDVFPIDKAPKSSLYQRIMNIRYKALLRTLHIKQGMSGYLENGVSKRLLRSALLTYGKFTTASRLMGKINRLCTHYSLIDSYKSDAVFVTDALYTRIPLNVFDAYEEVLFENEFFMVAQGYKEWLDLEYGDYMQLPPVEERSNYHNIIEMYIPEDIKEKISNNK